MYLFGLISITHLITTMSTMVTLIRLGGWFPILEAILLLLHYFGMVAIIIVLVTTITAVSATKLTEKSKEMKKDEGIRD